MIIAANSTNTAYRPGFNYTGFSGAQFSWSQNCSGTGNNSCLAIDEALVKFDLYGMTGAGQNLTNYCQASTTIGELF